MKVIRLNEANFDKIVEELKFGKHEQIELKNCLAEQNAYDEVGFFCPIYIYTDGVIRADDSWSLVSQPYLEAMFNFDYPQDQSAWFKISRKSRQQSIRMV